MSGESLKTKLDLDKGNKQQIRLRVIRFIVESNTYKWGWTEIEAAGYADCLHHESALGMGWTEIGVAGQVDYSNRKSAFGTYNPKIR